jgi:uncharacterized protein (TIGR01777 family)
MRVLLAGGSGLIGRALAQELVKRGHETIVLSRHLREAETGGLPDGVRIAGWDGKTAEGWGELADGAEAVVNLAGAGVADGRWTPQRKRTILESRVNAGRAVAEAVQRASHRPRVVVQASGVNYYGVQGDDELPESSPAGSDFLARLCVEWEQSSAPVSKLGVRQVVIRSGLVLSTQGGSFPRLLLPFRLFVGGRLGNGRQWLPWIHIADEVAAVCFLIESEDATGAFNLTAPAAVTNHAFAAALGRAMGRPSLVPVPAFLLRLLFGEMAMVLLEGQRVVPRRLLDMGFRFRFPKLEGALRDLLG